MAASRQFTDQVSQALAELDASIDDVEVDLARLRGGALVDGAALARAAAGAAVAAERVAAVVAAAADEHGVTAAWGDRVELRALVDELTRRIAARATEAPRARLRALAAVLAAGALTHRTQRRRDELAALRQAACDELTAIAASAEPGELPGPDAAGWLAWAWALHEPDDTPTLDALRADFSAVAEFVDRVEPSLWEPADAEAVAESGSAPESAPAPAPEAEAAPEPAPVPAPEAAEFGPEREPEAAPDPEAAPAPKAEPEPELQAEAEPEPEPEPAPEAEPEAEAAPEAEPEAEAEPAPEAESSPETEPALEPEPEPDVEQPSLATTFAEFRAHHWIKPDGACAGAPWLDDAFLPRIDERMIAALGKEQFARLWLLAAAAEQRGGCPFLATGDVERVAAIFAAPTSPCSWLAPRSPVAVADARPTPAWRVRVFLAALRTDGAAPPDAEALLDRVDLRAPNLRAITLGLFAIGAAGVDPIAHMRDELEGATDAKKLKRRVEAARTQLHAELARLGPSLDGVGWGDIVADVTAVVAPLLADGAGATSTALTPALTELARRCRDALAGVAPSPHQRAIADRAVRRAIDRAAAVTDLLRRLEAARRPGAAPPPAPLTEARAALHALTPLARPEEELCIQLLDRQLVARVRRDIGDPLGLVVADLCACPDLLALIPTVDADAVAAGDDGVVAHATQLDPIRAAAAILARDDGEPPPLAKVRQQLTLAGRDDLLAGLAAALSPAERAAVADAHAARVVRILGRADQIADPAAAEARHLAATIAADLPLVEAWLAAR